MTDLTNSERTVVAAEFRRFADLLDAPENRRLLNQEGCVLMARKAADDYESGGTPARTTAPTTPLNRHEAVRIATAGIADRASRSDDLSYADLGDAAVTALVDMGVLDAVDLDAVSEEQRRRDAHSVLDRDQAEVERERRDGAA